MAPAARRRSRYIATYLELGALLALLPACTCNDLAGREAQLTLAARELPRLRRVDGPGPCALELAQLRLGNLTPEPELQPPRVVFRFDLEGTLKCPGEPDLAVAAVGVERVPMAYREGRYVPAEGPLPGLQQALAEAREKAKRCQGAVRGAPADADCPAGEPHWPQVKHLALRVERGKGEVTAELADGTRKHFFTGGEAVPGPGVPR